MGKKKKRDESPPYEVVWFVFSAFSRDHFYYSGFIAKDVA